MLLNFFVARLNVTRQAKVAELYLRYKAPGDGEDFATNEAVLTSFCYPLGPESQKPTECMAAEEYTFTLTQGDGSRLPGFCRRFLPPQDVPGPAGKLRYSQVICLITEAPWCAFFFKVLQIVEQLMMRSEGLLDRRNKDLPAGSLVGGVLADLAERLSKGPALGQVIRLPLPKMKGALNVSPPKRVMLGPFEDPLLCTSEFVELQVPPDCGNGEWNAGVSLARLLWHVPVPAMLTLVASMLMERRVILVGQSRDMVSAAVHAAAALLYPFKWHHIYLPVLPASFKDYLTAPMPFIIGMPAQLLPALKAIPMSEVTMIDLDLGRCEPAPGGPYDDARLLPWKDRLEAALQAAFSRLRSPTEYESNPFIAGVMQEYLLKLMGSYRKYIHEDTPQAAAGTPTPRQGSNPSTPRNGGDSRDDTLKGSGYYFNHAAFVAQHRGGEKAKAFLGLLRQSQLYEMWVQERLKAASEGYPHDDSFEQKVAVYQEKEVGARVRDMGSRLGAKYKTTVTKWAVMMKKQGGKQPEWGGDVASNFAAGKASLNRRVEGDPTSGPPLVNLAHFFETESDNETESQVSDSIGPHSRNLSMSSLASESLAPASADDDRRSASGAAAEPSGRGSALPSPRGGGGGDAPALARSSAGAASAAMASAKLSLMDKARNLKERFRDAPALMIARLDDPPRRAPPPAWQGHAGSPHPLAPPPSYAASVAPTQPPPQQQQQPSHPLAPSPTSTSSPSPTYGYPSEPQNRPYAPGAASRPAIAKTASSGHSKFLSILDHALNGLDSPSPRAAPAPSPQASPPASSHPNTPPNFAHLWSNVTTAVSNVATTLQHRTSNAASGGSRPSSRRQSSDALPAAPPAASPAREVDDFLAASLRSSGLAPTAPPAYAPHLAGAKSLLEMKTIGSSGGSGGSITGGPDMLKAVQPSAPSAAPHRQPSLDHWDPFGADAFSAPTPQPAPVASVDAPSFAAVFPGPAGAPHAAGPAPAAVDPLFGMEVAAHAGPLSAAQGGPAASSSAAAAAGAGAASVSSSFTFGDAPAGAGAGAGQLPAAAVPADVLWDPFQVAMFSTSPSVSGAGGGGGEGCLGGFEQFDPFGSLAARSVPVAAAVPAMLPPPPVRAQMVGGHMQGSLIDLL